MKIDCTQRAYRAILQLEKLPQNKKPKAGIFEMKLLDPKAKYSRSPDLLSVEMDGDLVMMSIDSGNYFGVSGAGPHIWQLIEKPRSFDELVEAICAEFEVDQETAAADLEVFLHKLSENGMLEAS